MKDIIFKNLKHSAPGFKIVKPGTQIAKGYKPDVVLQNGNEYIIMECDTGTSRKGYLGGMIKAAKFLTDKKKGILVYVIKEKRNTTTNQISEHLKDYFYWIELLTNLSAIYIIAVDKYYYNDTILKLLKKGFLKHSKIILSKKHLSKVG